MESLERSNSQAIRDTFSLYNRNHVNRFGVNLRADTVTTLSNVICSNTCEALFQSSTNNIEGKEHNKVFGLFDSVGLSSPTIATLSDTTIDKERSLRQVTISDPEEISLNPKPSENLIKHPVFISSVMENSNNAVDSVPMFCNVSQLGTTFKLPICNELSFNGTINKHLQKLKPIVDPTKANTIQTINSSESKDATMSNFSCDLEESETLGLINNKSSDLYHVSCSETSTALVNGSEDAENNFANNVENSAKCNAEQSYSSLEQSFDSGVRSPDMFSDEEEPVNSTESVWSSRKDYENYQKRIVTKMEETLQGILPPPSVTVLKIDVNEMLRRYYKSQETSDEVPILINSAEINAVTPTKRISYVELPDQPTVNNTTIDSSHKLFKKMESMKCVEADNSMSDRSISLSMNTEIEAKETTWPDILKCRYYDVYYNVTKHSEKLEQLSLRLAERFVGAETDSSVCVHSGGLQSPSSAAKRKAIQLKMAQMKSPGRRLSHLARRRQVFCRAGTINDKIQNPISRMVLIDKNFFPHRKLINSSERKSPRKRTPSGKTPVRKTPGKKTPAKTPKAKSGGSSHKKVMRRLVMDTESMTRSQPTREMLKRALFISPENNKNVSVTPSSVPIHAMKSKRALFSSPNDAGSTKDLDSTNTEHSLKRTRDTVDDEPENNRAKIAKSLSFGGDLGFGSGSQLLTRRTSEVARCRKVSDLNEIHKKKLLWGVSEALRLHGWRMSTPGFREKASLLARLTRQLLALPPHAAKLAAPKQSTSEIMLKLARQYVTAIIQGRSIEECMQEERLKLANAADSKITGYISFSDYQQRIKQQATSTITTFSQIKENDCAGSMIKPESRSGSKNILQDKIVNIDTSSNSSSNSMLDKTDFFRTQSMPTFEEAAKMRARRQISFDNVDFPKR